jgi:hypothetical protein
MVAVAAAAFAHEAAVVVGGLGFFGVQEIAELGEECHNKEDAEDCFAGAGHDRVVVADEGNGGSEQGDESKNLRHIKFEPLFFS